MARLGDLIEGDVLTAERHEPIARAAGRMYEQKMGSVCVLDADGQLAGIFTERDLLRACAAGVDTHASTVGNWMTTSPITAAITDEAADALQVMLDGGFRHLPVAGEGGLVGVVSMRALTAALQRDRAS